jgi:photosystem II stability/assembly factor-like uncharacterized protein
VRASEWELVASETGGSVTALARAEGNVVFATTPVGVHRSADGGHFWRLSGTEAGVAFAEAVAVAGSHIFAGAPDGLHLSKDGGETWQHALTGSRIAAVCAGGGIVLAGTDTDGVLRSEDAGAHWSGVNAGLLDLEVLAVCLSPNFRSDRVAFVGTASGLYRSRNGGDSWRAVETGLEEPAVQAVAMGSDRLVVVGTEADGLVVSEDGGATWHQPSALAELSVWSVAISPHGSIAAATDTGLFVSADRGHSWNRQPGGPGAVLALAYLQDAVLLAAAERTGVWRLEQATWTESSAGLHASLLSTLAVGLDGTVWAAGPTEGVRVWRDHVWRERNDGLPDTTVLGVSVTSEGHAFAATPRGIYTWRGRGWQLAYAGSVRALSGTKHMVALTECLIVSGDLAATWRTLPTPFDLSSVVALAAHASTVAVAIREQSETVLWHTDDGAEHWQRVPLDAALTALAVARDSTLWVATKIGVFFSRDKGQTFEPVGGPKRAIAIAPPYALELGGRLWRRRPDSE